MVNARKWLRSDIGEEFLEARLGDARRTRRLQEVARLTEGAPEVGFPQMVETDGELEAIYRFLSDGIAKLAVGSHVVEIRRPGTSKVPRGWGQRASDSQPS